jgi:S1/P1 Nuclease
MRVSSLHVFRLFFAVLATTSIFVQPTRAWDAEGHELVATIAGDHLNAKAREAVNSLAVEMINPEQPYDAISLSCWMDDIRKNTAMPYHGEFLSWHYIDIGLLSGDPRPSFEPGGDNEVHGNVVQALKRAVVVLKGGTDPYIKTKAMACAMAMHLVGDIHQPLHCATKYFVSYHEFRQDFGGNKEEVLNEPIGDPKFNLHAFWDSAWRASFDEASGDIVIDLHYQEGRLHNPANLRELASELEKGAPPADIDLEPAIDKWARESNAIARDFVYPGITVTDSKKSCRLSSNYVAKADAIARQRLVLAGLRLATLLNETLGANGSLEFPPSYPAGPPSQSY